MTTRRTPRPVAPGPVRLTPSGEPGVWSACGDRFTITRFRPGRGASADDREHAEAGALDIVDHHRRDIIGHHGTNTARVYDRADAVGLIERALRIEWRAAAARWDARNTPVGV